MIITTTGPCMGLDKPCPCESGKPFGICHGAPRLVQHPTLAAAPVTRKLDLACGQNPREGFEGVDRWEGAKHRVNLFKFPWPFEDSSVAEIYCLPGDQRVNMADGSTKPIERVVVGDAVMGRSGPTRVLRTLVRSYDGAVYRIATANGVVVVTEEHPIGTPAGWFKANQLRNGDSVWKVPSKVQATHLVDCVEISTIVRDLSAPAQSSFSRFLDNGQAATTPRKHQIGLRALAAQMGAKDDQQAYSVALPTNDQDRRILPFGVPSAIANVGRRNVEGAKYSSGLVDNRSVRIRDRDLNTDLRARRDVEIDRAFAVNDPGEPRSIRIAHVESIEAHHYAGLVFNLITEDHTFCAEGFVTHNCSHFIEHIPQIEVDDLGNQVPFGEGQNLFFRFFDECHRILVPDGWMNVLCPSATTTRGFQDPTHQRFIVAETFAYLSSVWRKSTFLDHYGVKCDFAGHVNSTVPIEMNTLHQEAQMRRMRHEWNTMIDWTAQLRAIKPGSSIVDVVPPPLHQAFAIGAPPLPNQTR